MDTERDVAAQTELLALRRRVLELEQHLHNGASVDERYRQIFEHNWAVKLVIDPQDGAIIDANPAACAFYGYERARLQQMRITEINILAPDEVAAEMTRAAAQQRNYFLFRHRLATGEIRDVEVHSSPIEVKGRHLLYSIVHDITDRKRAEEALRDSEARFRSVFADAAIGMAIVELEGKFIQVNPALCTMLGYSAAELQSRGFIDITHLDDRQLSDDYVQAMLRGDCASCQFEKRYVHKDGYPLWVLINSSLVRDPRGRPLYLVTQMQDITERKEFETKLRHIALYDSLTGLPNRSLCIDRLGHAIARRRRTDAIFAVLFLDLDRFKTINDSLGHAAGDHLLIEIGRRLGVCVRTEDTVARLGGDEFVILLENIEDISDATLVADRVHYALRQPFMLNGHEVVTSTSIGIVLCTTDEVQPEDLLRDADIAMYRAKSMGKAHFEVFDKAMHLDMLTRLKFESQLRHAIERGEFRLEYQPLVSLHDGQVLEVEALVRWEHPERGLIGPLDFIPVAEETGLIVPLGHWVLREACLQARIWHEAGWPIQVAVNLSARQFLHGFEQEMEQILVETGVAPAAIKLELTETAVMEHAEMTIRLLAMLHNLGVQVSIDDFGTGYSSLSYLRRLPVTTLKIDRSFVQDLAPDSNNAAITTAIIAMAHRLNLRVVAEGVETAEQLAFLHDQECDTIQGFLYSRPLPPSELTRLLEAGPWNLAM